MQGEQDPTDLQTSLSPPRGRPPSPAVRYRRKVLGSSPSGDPLPRQADRVFSFSSGREVKGTLVISPFHRGWAERGAPPVRRRKCEHAAVWRPWVTQGSASVDEVTDSIKTRQAPERLAALPRRISCWLADSILSGSPLPSTPCRTVALDRLPAFSFLGELASRLRLCGMAQGGRVPGGFPAMAIAARGVLDHLRRIASHNTDKQVRGWRKHWERGADARWSSASNGVNPYPPDSYRASAWSAGWRWAEHRADRRKPHATRLAHPYRRNSDTLIRLVRRTNAGAVGVSALTIVAAILEIRRRRARAK